MSRKGTDEDVEKLINARIERRAAFSGRRNAAAHGWEIVLKDIGLEGEETEELGPGPGPSKRQWADPVLEFLQKEAEKAEERARREEQREERLLTLLEKIVDKIQMANHT
ncbi:hypothetical protein AAFF_G00407120 [Aldrovandia affinis]|uniref:Uncharacterized protein n=1 Tax=Aldrovandia affinis TaxID=143900 RepID=A0AAD7SCS8_9TELE|nr:hypothetical protein AAFF_G00407120 [Aldrovandia affinis]